MKVTQRSPKYQQMHHLLNEKQWRQYLVLEAQERGQVRKVAREAGASPNTIKRGMQELAEGALYRPGDRQRKAGGGRNKIDKMDPTLSRDVERMLEPKGDPMSLLRWTSKSVAKLRAALRVQGHQVCETALRRIFHALGYALKANKKTLEGGSHPLIGISSLRILPSSAAGAIRSTCR